MPNTRLRHGSRAPVARCGRPLRVPLAVPEELFLAMEGLGDPATMHLEVRVAGAFDEPRLRGAIAAACALHLMTRVRLAARRILLRPAYWEAIEPDAAALLATSDAADDAAMDALRGHFLSAPIDLRTGPPLRALLVHRASGDSLLLSIHHAVADGIGGVRFVDSVARAYAQRDDPVPDVDPVTARDLRSFLGRGQAPARAGGTVRGRFRKVAPVAGHERPSELPYGVCTSVLPAAECRRLDPRPYGDDVTLNDLLIAALHRTVATWNAARGVAFDPVGVLVPVNMRPAAWHSDVVANLFLAESNQTTAAQRQNPFALLAAVCAQTGPLKQRAGFSRLLSRPDWFYFLVTRVYLPLMFQLLPWLPVRVDELGRRAGQSVSVLCANLGRIDRKITGFGGEAGELTEFWASPPAWRPLAIAMTTAVLRGRLHVGLRYHRRLFDADDARALSVLFLETLVALGGPVGAARDATEVVA